MFCLGIFSLLSVLDLIFSKVKLSDSLSFAIDKELPLSQNEKTLYRSIDYYTNLSNQKFLSWKNLLNKRFKETLATTFFLFRFSQTRI